MTIIIQFVDESWTNFLVCLKHPNTNWTPESTRSCHLQMEKRGTKEFIQDSWTWTCCEYDFWDDSVPTVKFPHYPTHLASAVSPRLACWGDIGAYCCNGWYLVSAPNYGNHFVVTCTHWSNDYLNALIVYRYCSVSLEQPWFCEKGSLQTTVLFSNGYDHISFPLTISSPFDSFLKLFQNDGIAFIVTAKKLGL